MIDWSNEPDFALPGVGGHFVHGHEGPWCPRPPLDGGGQVWVADGQGLAEAHEKFQIRLQLGGLNNVRPLRTRP